MGRPISEVKKEFERAEAKEKTMVKPEKRKEFAANEKKEHGALKQMGAKLSKPRSYRAARGR
jgi:hypothetical protein